MEPHPLIFPANFVNGWVFRALLFFLVAPLAITAPATADQTLLPYKRVRDADDFNLRSLSGKRFRFSSLKDKVVLLNFWATWCPPCKKEMPSMERLYREYKSSGFEVVAVALDKSSPVAVSQFAKELGISFITLHDPDGITSNLYSVSGIPYSYLVNREGKIVFRVVGELDWDDEKVKSTVEDLLSEKK